MQDLLNNPGGFLRDRGYAGSIVDENTYTSISKVNVGQTIIDFGAPVATAGDGKGCHAVASDSDVIIGFAIRYALRPYGTDGTVSFAVNETVPVAKSGRMYVTAEEDALEGDHVISVTGNGLGSSSHEAAGAGRVEIAGAKWAEPVSAGSVGIIEFNLLGR